MDGEGGEGGGGGGEEARRVPVERQGARRSSLTERRERVIVKTLQLFSDHWGGFRSNC